jgi:aryl-alcohol dehydrogenase-like predicted oxidoreductase
MKYRVLGGAGLRVSVVGLGTWQFSGEWGKRFTQTEVDQLLETARDHGVNLIDTAECYGDHLAEALVGKAIQADRDDWVVATKFGHRFHAGAVGQEGWSPGSVRRDDWTPQQVLAQLEASLRALRTDHIDIYQFHSCPNEVFDRDDLWELLHTQVAAGKVRHLGVSLDTTDAYQAGHARERGATVVQVGYNRLDASAEKAVLPACLDDNLGVLAREPLANGFLSGKYRPDASITAADDWRAGQEPAEMRRKLELVEEVRRTEVPEDTPMAAWAIAWCLRHPALTSVVAGCKSSAQVEANAAAANLDLPRTPSATAGDETE